MDIGQTIHNINRNVGHLNNVPENIARRWSSLGVGGTGKEVQDVVHVLSGTGFYLLLDCPVLTLMFIFCLSAGHWPNKNLKNIDIIRMHSACTIMDVDARKSIYYMAQQTLGQEAIKTDQ